jgi:hypothetical protein
MRQTGKEGFLRQYLLGQLTPELRQEIEEELLSGGELARDLEAAQDALFDDYAFNTLSESERENFERHFLLTPERLNKLRISQALDEYVRRHPRPAQRPSWWRKLLRPVLSPGGLKVAAPAAALVLCVAAVAMWRLGWFARDSAELMQAAVEKANREPLPGRGTTMVELRLSEGAERAFGDPRRAVVPQGAPLLRLALKVPANDVEHYTVRLTTEEETQEGAQGGKKERKQLFTLGGLRPQDEGGERVVAVLIPTEHLPTGDYRTFVTGSADGRTAEYPFQVVNRAVAR